MPTPKPPDARLIGDGPIEELYRENMRQVAQGLDEIFNGQARGPDRKTGFVLLVFPFNEKGGRCNYISNGAERADIIVLLREQLARFEAAAAAESRP